MSRTIFKRAIVRFDCTKKYANRARIDDFRALGVRGAEIILAVVLRFDNREILPNRRCVLFR